VRRGNDQRTTAHRTHVDQRALQVHLVGRNGAKQSSSEMLNYAFHHAVASVVVEKQAVKLEAVRARHATDFEESCLAADSGALGRCCVLQNAICGAVREDGQTQLVW
jgi:hypothetical protein